RGPRRGRANRPGPHGGGDRPCDLELRPLQPRLRDRPGHRGRPGRHAQDCLADLQAELRSPDRRLPRRRDGPPAGLPGSHRGRAHPGVPHGEEVRMIARRSALSVLALDTFAFTACFALWMLNGVLVTHLVETQTFAFDAIEVGWLLGAPVLTGSLLRLPVGILTDRYRGRRGFPAA